MPKLHLSSTAIVSIKLKIDHFIFPGKLTENTSFSFTATTYEVVKGKRRGMNEPIVNWRLLGDHDGLRARLGI